MTDSLLKKCVENDIVGFKEELKEMFQSNFSEKMDKIKKEIYKEPLSEAKNVTVDVDSNYDADEMSDKFGKKYKLKFKDHKQGVYITGTQKDILKFMRSDDGGYEDIEDLYPELF